MGMGMGMGTSMGMGMGMGMMTSGDDPGAMARGPWPEADTS